MSPPVTPSLCLPPPGRTLSYPVAYFSFFLQKFLGTPPIAGANPACFNFPPRPTCFPNCGSCLFGALTFFFSFGIVLATSSEGIRIPRQCGHIGPKRPRSPPSPPIFFPSAFFFFFPKDNLQPILSFPRGVRLGPRREPGVGDPPSLSLPFPPPFFLNSFPGILEDSLLWNRTHQFPLRNQEIGRGSILFRQMFLFPPSPLDRLVSSKGNPLSLYSSPHFGGLKTVIRKPISHTPEALPFKTFVPPQRE